MMIIGYGFLAAAVFTLDYFMREKEQNRRVLISVTDADGVGHVPCDVWIPGKENAESGAGAPARRRLQQYL